jgi:type III pantothenate kinase
MGLLLLVGNSRWHWAERQPLGGSEPLRCWHEPGPPSGCPDWLDLEAWVAVGCLPDRLGLPPQRRLSLEQVPLTERPPWLGVDRALAGWQAWRRSGDGVLVADAGTCLSLTWVDRAGRFRGGRISAGLGLQLRSLGAATAALPALKPPAAEPDAADPWPQATIAAMQEGCLRACAASIAQAWRDLEPEDACRLWLTGGDGSGLMPLLVAAGLEPVLAPDLCLQALSALTPSLS